MDLERTESLMQSLKINKLFQNETLRNGAFFTLFSFVNKGMNFILLILLARFITPTEYGYWSLFGTIVMFMGYFMAMTTEGYISLSYFQEGMVGVKKSFSCILPTTLIVSGALFFITTLLRDHLQQILKLPWQYLYFAIEIAFFTVYSNICLDFLRIKKNIALYGLFSCGSAFLVFSLSIILVKYFLMGWQGCVQAQFFSVLLFGVIGLCYFLFSKKIGKPNKKHWITMLCWGIPLIPHLATAFIRFGCDRYIINHYYTIEEVGLFSFAVSLSAAIVMIGSGFNDANSVNIYEILANKDIEAERKIVLLSKQKKTISLVYLFSALTITVFGYLLIPIFFPKYTLSVNYFAVLAIYAFLQCIYFLYTNYLFFFKKTRALMVTTFSFAIIHLLTSLVLTPFSVSYTCLVYVITQLGIVIFIRKKAIKALEENLNLKPKCF